MPTLEMTLPLSSGNGPAPAGQIISERRPVSVGKTGLVSILVPCFGQLEHTRFAIPRLLRHSREPFELVFVDAGSADGTKEYLEGLAAAATVRVEIVGGAADWTLAEACKEALSKVRGDFVVLLSNEALVPEGWLNQLIALARLGPEIGMVGAMSNYAAPPQWVGRLPYRLGASHRPTLVNDFGASNPQVDVDPVDQFAREWRDRHRGQSFEAERLGGPCLFFKAEVLQKVDLATVASPLGCIDADDLSLKVRQAGYRLACCQDLFVHYFGSRLFAALRIEPALTNPTHVVPA